MTTGRCDAATGSDHARTFDRAALDRAAELDDHRAVRAEIADRGHAGLEGLSGTDEHLDRRRRHRLSAQDADRIGLGAETEMDVGIDEARQQGQPVERDRCPAWGIDVGHDGRDTAVLDDDGTTPLRRGAGSVDERGAFEDQAIGDDRLLRGPRASSDSAARRDAWRPRCRRAGLSGWWGSSRSLR
jgi:hypothetical protein